MEDKKEQAHIWHGLDLGYKVPLRDIGACTHNLNEERRDNKNKIE